MRSSKVQVPGSKERSGFKFHAPARRPRSGIWNLRFGTLALLVFLAKPASVLACAACYGASDAPMAKGMNWGIFSLLGVVTMVLGGIATFFVFIGKKSAEASSLPPADSEKKTEPSEKA